MVSTSSSATGAQSLGRARLQSQRVVAAPESGDAGGTTRPGAARGAATGGPGAIAHTVRHLVATQAQDFGQALWALGLRTPGSVRSDVLAAMDNGSVVRSAPMRGTLHFVAAEDLRWLLGVTHARTVAAGATRFRDQGLDLATFERSRDVARDVLAGNPMSRDEFLKALEAAGVSTAGQRGYHLIFWLSQHLVVCWGPSRGTQQALVLVDEWIPPGPELSREAAVEEFALRYFVSHGPATLKDFVWWSKLTVVEARRALAAVEDRLVRTELGGETYWAGETAGSASSRTLNAVQVLPGFDEYLLGYQDRSLTLPPEFATRVAPGANGIFLPLIVSRGQVVGTWKRPAGSARPEAVPEPFASLTEPELAGFHRAIRTYSRFMLG